MFSFNDVHGCNKVLEQRPLVFAIKAIFMKKWGNNMDFAKEEFMSILIWCNLYNSPQFIEFA